jgi:hypothetical protein
VGAPPPRSCGPGTARGARFGSESRRSRRRRSPPVLRRREPRAAPPLQRFGLRSAQESLGGHGLRFPRGPEARLRVHLCSPRTHGAPAYAPSLCSAQESLGGSSAGVHGPWPRPPLPSTPAHARRACLQPEPAPRGSDSRLQRAGASCTRMAAGGRLLRALDRRLGGTYRGRPLPRPARRRRRRPSLPSPRPWSAGAGGTRTRWTS